MTFPLLFSIGHHSYSGTGEDAHGNEIALYTPPLDQPGTTQPVYGWSIPSSTEPSLAGHDRVLVDVQVLAPPTLHVQPRDVIDLPADPAGQFEMIGYAEDYTKGPFGFQPGAVINLQKVDG
ncbi:hypothetical protein [Nocardia sp. NPDC052566]|uniref:hypothetical protein n=1 Tax=Nocardia sp. NPDC052566 TaxID=3364330 RepID=UPI0037C935A9